ncbi:MAG: alanine:cation symporter family protein [Desulfurococcaceae archaeon]
MDLLAIYRFIAYDILWNPFLPFLFFAVAIIASIFLRFIQFRKFGFLLKDNFARAGTTGVGVISRLTSFFTTVGGVVGLGNIVGVSSAMASGGPGAVFWMWMSALVGMGLKPAECTLAAYTRMVLPDGRTYGGPMWYMEYLEKMYKIPKKICYILVGMFIAGFFLGILFPVYYYTMLEMTKAAFPFLTTEQVIAFEIIVVAIVVIIWLFELPGVGKFQSIAVPLMLISYVILGLMVLANHAANIPQGISDIFYYAFNPAPAVVGGFAGTTLFNTVRVGVARGIYSNEAGWGTSPHIYSSAKGLRHPGDTVPPSSMDVFLDTIVICTFTGLVIASSGEWKTGVGGYTAVVSVVRRTLGDWAANWLFLSTFLFMFTTLVTGGTYTVVQWRYLLLYKARKSIQFTEKVVKTWILLFRWPAVAIACYLFSLGAKPAELWVMADIVTGISLYPNLIAVVLLAPLAGKLVKEWETKLAKGELKEEMAAEPWKAA